MCLAIYPVDKKIEVEVKFAFERIFQWRNGTADITLDMLVKNCSKPMHNDIVDDFALRELRVILPYRFHTPKRSKRGLAFVSERARKATNKCVQLATSDLALPHAPHNWPYRTIGHVKNLVHDTSRNSASVSPYDDETTVEGIVASNWEICFPDDSSVHKRAWTLLYIFDATVIDIRASPDQMIPPGESAWFRLKLRVPRLGYNAKSIPATLFSRSRKFIHFFKSPAKVVEDIRNEIQCGAVPPNFERDAHEIQTQVSNAVASLPLANELPIVEDWRTMIYQEYGLAVEPVQAFVKGRLGKQSAVVDQCDQKLPKHADPPKAARSFFPPPGSPGFLHDFFGRFKKERTEIVSQFLFGNLHGHFEDDQCMLTTNSRATNGLLHPWISLLLCLISLAIAVYSAVLC